MCWGQCPAFRPRGSTGDHSCRAHQKLEDPQRLRMESIKFHSACKLTVKKNK